MAKTIKIDKEKIIQAAFELVKAEGEKGLNARVLAQKLGCSTQPIFSNFSSMDEVKSAVIQRVGELYTQYTKAEMERTDQPAYKSSGMAYVRFAREESELFKLLFMRNRSQERGDETYLLKPIVEIIMKATGLTEELAYLLHVEMWTCVHGIATMLATSYLQWDEQTISMMLTDVYNGLKDRFVNGRKE